MSTNDPIPYASPERHVGWIARHAVGSPTRMIAFAILMLAGLAWRYLTNTVGGQTDIYDGGKYVLIASCIGFVVEYAFSFAA